MKLKPIQLRQQIPRIYFIRRGGRVVEGARLESVYTPKGYRGFESLPLRPDFSGLNKQWKTESSILLTFVCSNRHTRTTNFKHKTFRLCANY